ncbi:MAG: Ig-like domain-containing protein, partial [Lachnospiraceae bacterium]|nr:Ig-like domain-containing protein [Lachnospiraceae bacterium]
NNMKPGTWDIEISLGGCKTTYSISVKTMEEKSEALVLSENEKEYKLNLNDTYYKVTVKEDGYYYFLCKEAVDTLRWMRIYNESGEKLDESYVDVQPEYTEHMRLKLEKGKSYFISLASTDEQTGDFYCKYQKENTIVSYEMDLTEEDLVYILEDDGCIRPSGAVVIMKYEDRTERRVKIYSDLWYATGFEVDTPGLCEGENIIKILLDGEEVQKYTVSGVSLKDAETSKLTLGEKLSLPWKKTRQIVEFTVPEDGSYECYFTGTQEEMYRGNLYGSLDGTTIQRIEYWLDVDVFKQDVGQEKLYFRKNLKAGTYYFILNNYLFYNDPISISIKKGKEIKSISLDTSEVCKEFIYGINDDDTVDMSGMKINIVFTDNTTKTIAYEEQSSSTINEWSAYGFRYEYMGLTNYNNIMYPGTGEVKVSLGDWSENYTIQVKKIQDASIDTLAAGNVYNEVMDKRNLIFKVTADESGIYNLQSRVLDNISVEAELLDENLKELYTGEDYNEHDFQMTATLEKGKNYYLVLEKSSTGSIRVPISILKTGEVPCTNGKHAWASETVSVKPTCTEKGQVKKTCSLCNEVITEYIDALQKGAEERSCSICGQKEQRETAVLTPFIKLNYKSLPLKVKQKTKVVEVTSMQTGDKIKSWTSSSTKIATVNKKTGEIKGMKAGTARITVELQSGIKAVVIIKVQKKTVKTTKLTVNKKSISLKKGKTFTITAARTPVTSEEKVTYTSSNKKIATVSSNGKIKAKKKGSCKITVKSGKKRVVCKVKVK